MQTRLILSTTFAVSLLLTLTGCLGPQKIVIVNAPQINCLFSSNCVVTVDDSTAPITFANSTGSGFLQSRTYQGLPGTPEAGLYAFEYRIDLTGISGPLSNCITSLALPPVMPMLFNYGGQFSNQVWVISSGGLGVVGPSSVTDSGTNLIFNFSQPVFSGTSSYFFGILSQYPPTNMDGLITSFEGSGFQTKPIAVRSPGHP